MRINQILTDYIAASVLTTQGDLVVRGAALPERLAAGIDGKVLTAQGAGAALAYENLFNLQANPGDIWVRGATFTEILAAGVAGTVLTGQGAGAIPAYADKTHKLFTQAWYPGATYGVYGVTLDTALDQANALIMIPDDYLRNAKIEIIYVANATGANMHVSLVGLRMQVGETNWTDQWTLMNQDIGATVADKLVVYDVTAQFSAFRANDLIMVQVAYSPTVIECDVDFSGIRFEYVSS